MSDPRRRTRDTRRNGILGKKFAPLSLILLAACSDPVYIDFGPDALLQTDALTYRLTEVGGVLEMRIPFTFENRFRDSVYLASCGEALPPTLDKKFGEEWRTAWVAPDYDCRRGPRVLAPGARWDDTLRVYAHPFGGNREPQFRTRDVTGVHRLNWTQALSSYDLDRRPVGEPLPLPFRVSNEFYLNGP